MIKYYAEIKENFYRYSDGSLREALLDIPTIIELTNWYTNENYKYSRKMHTLNPKIVYGYAYYLKGNKNYINNDWIKQIWEEILYD